MNGELSRVDAEALANAAAAAVAAAVANLPDQGGQNHLSQHQVLALAGHAEDQDDPEEFGGTHVDGQAQARKPRKLRKPNDVARCQVDGCGRDLSDAKLYLRRYSVCEPHFKAEWVMLSGGRYRFCQQCNKFQSLENFAGSRRSCKARSEDRNLRRRKQRTDERTLAGDDTDGMAGRLLKGGHPLGALSLPSRAALCDNGALRQLGGDLNDATGLSAVQYANQVQQLLFASGGAAAAGLMPAANGGGGGGGLGAQLPGVDLAALVGGVDLSGLGAPAQGANALQLLTAAVAANGGGRGNAGGGVDSSSSVLQQLQLAQLATVLAGKGGAAGGPAGGGHGGLGAPLGAAGLNAGGLGAGLNGTNLAQQLLLQQAAVAAAAGAGSNNAANSSTGPMMGAGSLSEATNPSSALDLQSLMAQQLLQQSTAAGQGGPLLLLSNQNVMLLSLDPLGILQQQAK